MSDISKISCVTGTADACFQLLLAICSPRAASLVLESDAKGYPVENWQQFRSFDLASERHDLGVEGTEGNGEETTAQSKLK